MPLPKQLQGLKARCEDPASVKLCLPSDLLAEIEMLCEEVGGQRFRSAVLVKLIRLGMERLD